MPISDSHSFTQNPLPSFNSTVNTSVMGSRHPLPDLNVTPTTSDDDVDFTVPQPVLHVTPSSSNGAAGFTVPQLDLNVTPSASNADVGFTVPQLHLSGTPTTSQPPLLLELDPETGAIGPSLAKVLQMKRPLVQDEIATLIIHSDAERLYYRKAVRETRMIFDALRIRLEAEQKLRTRGSLVYEYRPELSATKILKTCGRWLFPHYNIVGSIPEVYVGDLFFYRAELSMLGIHRHQRNCIDSCRSASTNWQAIATAIVYNEEKGTVYRDVIIYSANGEQDEENSNKALTRSREYGIDVRVIRGMKIYKKGAPCSSTMHYYSYDGLYKVVNWWYEKQMPGFKGKFFCKLVRISGQAQMGSEVLTFAHSLIFKPWLNLRPEGNKIGDISFGTEVVPVKLFNDVDANLDSYSYSYTREHRFPEPIFPETIFPPFYYLYTQHSYGTGLGCNCQTDDCDEDCLCKVRNGGQCPYNHNGFLLRGKPVVYECGNACKCPPSCRYRVSQRGLRTSLEVYRSREMGSEICWGVRSLESIKAGEFICEYAGAIQPVLQGVKLDGGSSMIYPQQFADKWAEWGDLSSIYGNDKRPTFPGIPPLDFAIDTSRLRNVGSYVRHSSTPNVMVQFVCFDNNNLVVPHLMLFAVENIPPMTPLCLDYGVAVADE